MIVDGQTLPERIRSQACTTAEAITMTVKHVSWYDFGVPTAP
jgi:hypothetical protein